MLRVHTVHTDMYRYFIQQHLKLKARKSLSTASRRLTVADSGPLDGLEELQVAGSAKRFQTNFKKNYLFPSDKYLRIYDVFR